MGALKKIRFFYDNIILSDSKFKGKCRTSNDKKNPDRC